MRSPKWTRDEVIVALDLYFRMGRRIPNPSDPEVIEVSRLLNAMTTHPPHVRPQEFRNPAGIVLKLANLRAIDPDHEGTGMTSIAKMDQIVWDEFVHDPQGLREAARLIRQAIL